MKTILYILSLIPYLIHSEAISTTEATDTTDLATTTSNPTTTESCDHDENEDWRVDYIGQSTQFRIYNPCDDKQFLKIKMTDLTEYDSNGRKTTNKVTGFASTDWQWDNPNGVNTEYDGYEVVTNTFTATNVVGDADFVLTTYLFKEDAVINDNETIIDANSLKWNVNITDWPFLDDNNYLQLCINLMTNKGNKNDNGGNDRWRAGEFEIQTFDSADCGDDSIVVNVSDTTNGGGNQRNLCFTFGVCTDETKIFYDPIVSHVNDGNNSGLNTNVGVIVGSIFGVLVFIGIVGLIYWFIIKKKRNGPYHGLLDT